MKNFYGSHKKEIDRLVTFLIALVAAGLFVKFALKLFAPFILAFILSLIISVPVDFISKKTNIPRFVSTLFSMVLILTVLIRALGWLLRLLSAQLYSFIDAFPETLDKAMALFGSFQESYYNLFAFFPAEMQDVLDQTLINLVPSITSWLGGYARIFSVSAVKAIPKAMIFIVVTIVSTFFMTKDKEKLTGFVSRQLPPNLKRTAEILRRDIFGALWGYIKAQLVLMCFSGAIAIAGLTLLKYQYSLLVGLMIACVDALPVFGPGFILWPWAAFSLLSGNYSYGICLFVLYLCIIMCRQLLEPKVLSSQIGLYPLVTLMSLYVGLMVFGAVGLILGPMLAIIVRSLQNAELLPNWK